MNDLDFGKHLWELAQGVGAPRDSADWWVEYGRVLRETSFVSMEQATALVERELGGVEVSDQKPDLPAQQEPKDPTPYETLPEGSGPRAATHRVGCSRKAQTDRAFPLTRDFNPGLVGYQGEDFRRDYPHVSPAGVLEQFFSHHIAKGDVSKNWLEKFFSYAGNAERIERERAGDKTSTDSMGQPLDPAERARRVQVARDHERENNEFIDQQMAAEQSEREGNHE